jgi:very-long-chain enoyl-CoA reductase
MNFIFDNDLTLIPIIRFIICIFFGILLGYLEYTKKFQLSYSKFNEKGNIDSKKGMFIIYFVPLLTYLYFYYTSTIIPTLYHKFIFFAVVFHFGKRCLEVLFLHKYSGKISLITTALICWAYSSISFTIQESVNQFTSNVDGSSISTLVPMLLGMFIYLSGQLSNFLHHILLTRLRSGSEKEYKIPMGGLFRYVNCPHYLSEIIAWIGIAIMSKYLIVYGLTFIMASYLVARSVNTSKWYREKIPNFPLDRKAIFPFVL